MTLEFISVSHLAPRPRLPDLVSFRLRLFVTSTSWEIFNQNFRRKGSHHPLLQPKRLSLSTLLLTALPSLLLTTIFPTGGQEFLC